jgi:hypothetical protein
MQELLAKMVGRDTISLKRRLTYDLVWGSNVYENAPGGPIHVFPDPRVR